MIRIYGNSHRFLCFHTGISSSSDVHLQNLCINAYAMTSTVIKGVILLLNYAVVAMYCRRCIVARIHVDEIIQTIVLCLELDNSVLYQLSVLDNVHTEHMSV